jgi:hypothetical protein
MITEPDGWGCRSNVSPDLTCSYLGTAENGQVALALVYFMASFHRQGRAFAGII